MSIVAAQVLMHRVNLRDLELVAAGLEGDDSARWLAAFPFNRDALGPTETESQSLSVVYNELEPGARLGTHRDGTEEALLVLAGRLRVSVGGETDTAGPDDLVLIPSEVPHSVENVGEETARMLGCFGSRTVESTFEGTVTPLDSDG